MVTSPVLTLPVISKLAWRINSIEMGALCRPIRLTYCTLHSPVVRKFLFFESETYGLRSKSSLQKIISSVSWRDTLTSAREARIDVRTCNVKDLSLGSGAHSSG